MSKNTGMRIYAAAYLSSFFGVGADVDDDVVLIAIVVEIVVCGSFVLVSLVVTIVVTIAVVG